MFLCFAVAIPPKKQANRNNKNSFILYQSLVIKRFPLAPYLVAQILKAKMAFLHVTYS